MLKIRLLSEDPDEVEAAIELFEALFPDMRFSSPRIGGNPKYANDPKYLAYGEPRIRDRKPIKVDIRAAHEKVTGLPAKRQKRIK